MRRNLGCEINREKELSFFLPFSSQSRVVSPRPASNKIVATGWFTNELEKELTDVKQKRIPENKKTDKLSKKQGNERTAGCRNRHQDISLTTVRVEL